MDGNNKDYNQVVAKQYTLDDLYMMVAFIYSDRNAERSTIATFSHFTEVCGMLSMHDRRKIREDLSLEDALCKALGWFFPLMAKFHIKSVEELIFRKYPYVCPYCRKAPHLEAECKQIKGTALTVNHPKLIKAYNENEIHRPKGLNEWQKMFSEIYPRKVDDIGISTLGLLEELGELAESIRVFDEHPKYFAGEAADIFSYIMGIANEDSLRRSVEDKETFDYEKEFLKRYPGLCVQCGYKICKCPPIPEGTVGRLSKELDIYDKDKMFSLDTAKLTIRGNTLCEEVLENFGGYSVVAQNFPFDRGDTNKAVILLCKRLAENIYETNPEIAKELREVAATVESKPKEPGSKQFDKSINNVVDVLNKVWPLQNLPILQEDQSFAGKIGRMLHIQSFKIGIVTAIPIEFSAMMKMFDEYVEHSFPNDPNDYVIGQINSKDGSKKHSVIATLAKIKGSRSATSVATHLLRSFPYIENVLMVGIAGGVPNVDNPKDHVRLGDIVVLSEDGLFQSDNPESAGQLPSAKLIGRVKWLETNRLHNKHPWEDHINRGKDIEGGKRPSEDTDKLYSWKSGEKELIQHPDDDRRKGMPKIHYGRIATVGEVLRDPDKRDEFRDKYNIKAIEMESSGIADSTWSLGIGYLVIRGICDYCDPEKSDLWQGYAAVVAASYARVLIESLPLIERE